MEMRARRKPRGGQHYLVSPFPGQSHNVTWVGLGTGDARKKRGWYFLDAGMEVEDT